MHRSALHYLHLHCIHKVDERKDKERTGGVDRGKRESWDFPIVIGSPDFRGLDTKVDD